MTKEQRTQHTQHIIGLSYDLSYAGLPKIFHQQINPTPVPNPSVPCFNNELAQTLGLPKNWAQNNVDYLAGNFIPKNLNPIAMAYSGHQFGGWSPLLGDGRAILVGEITAPDGAQYDLQLKGSGRTPYSRQGDGRATLGSVLREYIISEAMAGLGIPTTRSLAVITTGDRVQRERGFPGGVLARIARSHVRVGTFQFAIMMEGEGAVRALADYMINRYFPKISLDDCDCYDQFLRAVIARQASLIAQWMCVGFIHGVMNTDNMSIVGETIDYGPCAFMDDFHEGKVFSSIDREGRYAWEQQPIMGMWNLTRFAESLLPLLSGDKDKAVQNAQKALDVFSTTFTNEFYRGMANKFGLNISGQEDTHTFIKESLNMLRDAQLDFTVFFRRLTQIVNGENESAFLSLFADKETGVAWLEKWKVRATNTEAMGCANPIIIARNHRVDEAIRAAEDNNDFAPFKNLVKALQSPFVEQAEFTDLETPPTIDEIITRTFCGT